MGGFFESPTMLTSIDPPTFFFTCLIEKDLLTQEAKVQQGFKMLLLVLMKTSCSNILNAAVGSQKQIPLLSINAAAMQEEGRREGWELPIHRLINLPLHEQIHCKKGWDAVVIAEAGRDW